MPKSKRQIGKEQELRLAVKFYQKHGFKAWKRPGKAVSQSQDILTVFDVVAYRTDKGFHFSQVTTLDSGHDSLPTREKRKIEAENFDPRHATFTVMAWEKGKGWHFWVLILGILNDRLWTRLTEEEFIERYLR